MQSMGNFGVRIITADVQWISILRICEFINYDVTKLFLIEAECGAVHFNTGDILSSFPTESLKPCYCNYYSAWLKFCLLEWIRNVGWNFENEGNYLEVSYIYTQFVVSRGLILRISPSSTMLTKSWILLLLNLTVLTDEKIPSDAQVL